MAADNITPFVFDSLPVRGALISLSRSWRRMLRDHDYERLVRDTLGHAAAAAGLIAQSLKFDGAITLQIQGSKGLRLGVKKGGCAGMEYTMEYVDTADPNDEVVEDDGARVMIAPMAQMFLFGTEIDYEVSLLESGFKFNNPNSQGTCGCGESFQV